MSIERMADRALPLAERVAAYRWADYTGSGYAEAQDTLLADIAAADRLARGTDEAHRAFRAYQDAGWDTDADTSSYNDMMDRLGAYAEAMDDEANAALAAYRARMAQGVGNA